MQLIFGTAYVIYTFGERFLHLVRRMKFNTGQGVELHPTQADAKATPNVYMTNELL